MDIIGPLLNLPSIGIFFGLILLIVAAIFILRPGPRTRKPGSPIKTMIIFGPGGHCREMLTLLQKVDLKRKFSPVLYVVGADDKLTVEKLSNSGLPFDQSMVKYIRRSRHVGQSYFTSIFTTLISFVYSIQLVASFKCDLLICNGPGTCIPPLIASYFICRPKIIFIESFCRTTSLSLSGRIACYFADYILVQWPELSQKYSKCKYIGLMV